MSRNLILSTNSFIGKKVAIAIRYISEMGAVSGEVLEETVYGVFVQVKNRTIFYPWSSIIYIRVDEQ